MRQYFTFRNLVLDCVYNPKYSFDHELNTIEGLSYGLVCQKVGDNRNLGYFDYTGDQDMETIKELVAETLSKYSYHPKTIEKAKEFIEYCHGDNIESLVIDGDKIYFSIKLYDGNIQMIG